MPVRNVTESEQSEVLCFSIPIIASESKSSSSGPEIPRPRAARPALSSRSGHHGMFPRGPGHAASWGMAGRWDGMGEAVVVSKCKARKTHLIHMTLSITSHNNTLYHRTIRCKSQWNGCMNCCHIVLPCAERAAGLPCDVAKRIVVAASRFLAITAACVRLLSFAAEHRKSHWNGCMKVDCDFAVKLLHFGACDFPLKSLIQKPSKSSFFSPPAR